MPNIDAKELFDKGIEYFKQNQLSEAQENFEKALKLAPDRISILENLAIVYYSNKRFLDTENALNKIIKLGNNSSRFFNLMIKVLQKQGKIKELKLTEREIDIILFLKNQIIPQSVNMMQNKVWGYSSDLETHTVETHIYRLRKKIKDKFNDKNFITSEEEGYKI